ncbi:MAG: hypothetical protein AVDCRST_MAG33-1567 [uncultured Thermomicrobiales bacterium]|uniref:Uncharacterized protein n=1 Tax=uncultured Thermomicrobiales bacterium TaxID=1645740 RepID=A0A6J4UYQ3_9BACT|nr:MAG: hypothetical protein AVDCRST_MAG33-1567 [uncultured Thermomicrobiales bacterium]
MGAITGHGPSDAFVSRCRCRLVATPMIRADKFSDPIETWNDGAVTHPPETVLDGSLHSAAASPPARLSTGGAPVGGPQIL